MKTEDGRLQELSNEEVRKIREAILQKQKAEGAENKK